MKKKTIEKIPFLGLPKVKRNKSVEYVVVTAIKEVGREECLFLEAYRNRKDAKKIPAARIVIGGKDFGTYFPESGEWSRGKITWDAWSANSFIWYGNARSNGSAKHAEETNVLYSPEDMERIKGFTEGMEVYGGKWWRLVLRKQEDIRRNEYDERDRRKRERRQQALEDRKAHTEKLPEKRILEYADKVLFHEGHYLYYKKHRARADVACTGCGNVSADVRWKPGDSFESRFEKLIEEPRSGGYGTCPACGARGKYIPKGRAKNVSRIAGHLFLGQKYKDEGAVVRYINVEKEWRIELTCGEKDTKMCGVYEKLTGLEIARTYFEPGKEPQTDYQKYNPYDGENFWDDCNLGGLSNIGIHEAPIMPETYGNLKDTFLRYSAIETYMEASQRYCVNLKDYLKEYIRTPQIEILVKLGLTDIVRKLIKSECGIVYDLKAGRLDAFLGIRKEHVRQLVSHRGNIDILNVMQMEKRMGQRWTEGQIEQMAELRPGYIKHALDYMGIRRFLNHVAKYAGCGYGTMCERASERLRQTARTYIDYLDMRQSRGYDMTNSVYLFPRSLRAAHAGMVEEINGAKQDERMREVREKYPLIKQNYRKLRNRFYFEDDEFLIRPARDAGEIVTEGRTLHHCVGGDSYLLKHNSGENIILFLRFKEEPEVPYITVEIMPDTLHIRQWYGAHDKKPDKDRMRRWLDAYVKRLKSGRAAIEQETARQALTTA